MLISSWISAAMALPAGSLPLRGRAAPTPGVIAFPTLGARSRAAEPTRPPAVAVASGISSQGQGQFTTYAQVCAEALGVPFDSVSVRLGDTELLPFGRGAFAARGAVMGANAVLGAARRVRTKLLAHAAVLLQCTADDLEIADGQLRFRDGRATDLTVGAIARAVAPGGAFFDGEAATEPGQLCE